MKFKESTQWYKFFFFLRSNGHSNGRLFTVPNFCMRPSIVEFDGPPSWSLRLPCPPPALPTGILYSPQFRSHQETKMAARRTQRSIGKIGDCEQSITTAVYSKNMTRSIDYKTYQQYFVIKLHRDAQLDWYKLLGKYFALFTIITSISFNS